MRLTPEFSPAHINLSFVYHCIKVETVKGVSSADNLEVAADWAAGLLFDALSQYHLRKVLTSQDERGEAPDPELYAVTARLANLEKDALRVPAQLLEPPEDDDERIAMGLPVLDKRPVSTSGAVRL